MDPLGTLLILEGMLIAGDPITVKSVANGCRTTLHELSKGGVSVTDHRCPVVSRLSGVCMCIFYLL